MHYLIPRSTCSASSTEEEILARNVNHEIALAFIELRASEEDLLNTIQTDRVHFKF